MSIGVNNTSTTKTKGKIRFHKSLLTPTVIGTYGMSTATSNGQYLLISNAMVNCPNHTFAGSSNGDIIGSAHAYIYNITQKKIQKASMPVRYNVHVGDLILLTVGKAGTNATAWNNLGLTMPSEGDSMAMSVMLNLKGQRPVGGWKQTWTANF